MKKLMIVVATILSATVFGETMASRPYVNNQDSKVKQIAAADASAKASGVGGGSKTYTDSQISAVSNNVIAIASADAASKAGTAESNAKSYADTKKTEAISAASSDATSKAGTAKTEAVASAKSYADTEIAKKQDTLVSGTNIKTVNNQSLLGSGNVDVKSKIDGVHFDFNNDSSAQTLYTVLTNVIIHLGGVVDNPPAAE